jgi:hypothetical protein
MAVLIYILVFSLALGFKLFWDKRAKDSGRIINHSLSAAIDVVIYTLTAFICFGWDAGGWIVAALGLRWLLFDILFNLINGWAWGNYGTSSDLDKFLTKLGKWHLVPKIVLIILGVILILK